jgi:hypothetical protein
MAALAAELESAVHAAVEARNERWKVTMWSDLLKRAVAFLLTKGRDQDDVVAAAVGLIVYGVTTEEEVQGVAGQPPDQKNFRDTLLHVCRAGHVRDRRTLLSVTPSVHHLTEPFLHCLASCRGRCGCTLIGRKQSSTSCAAARRWSA